MDIRLGVHLVIWVLLGGTAACQTTSPGADEKTIQEEGSGAEATAKHEPIGDAMREYDYPWEVSQGRVRLHTAEQSRRTRHRWAPLIDADRPDRPRPEATWQLFNSASLHASQRARTRDFFYYEDSGMRRVDEIQLGLGWPVSRGALEMFECSWSQTRFWRVHDMLVRCHGFSIQVYVVVDTSLDYDRYDLPGLPPANLPERWRAWWHVVWDRTRHYEDPEQPGELVRMTHYAFDPERDDGIVFESVVRWFEYENAVPYPRSGIEFLVPEDYCADDLSGMKRLRSCMSSGTERDARFHRCRAKGGCSFTE